MASTKRELPFCDESQLKKARIDEWEPSSSSAAGSNLRVVLNPADCDIDFTVEGDGLLGSALYEEGFAYCWSGARANIGITSGKYCFGCKIVAAQPVQLEDTPINLQHVCLVGLSRGDDDVRNLGETLNSFGYGGTGEFSNSGSFHEYGERFAVGDTIICAVDLESSPMASISFSKNGNWLGVAKYFDAGPNGLGIVSSPAKRLHWESALFPHVLLKNVVVQLQFSIDDGLNPVQGYRPWDAAIADGNAMLGPMFSSVEDCELIMMVGLPASGKTTWAEKWVKEHPEKRYVLLGMNLVFEQMKVLGLLHKRNYGERFELLMNRANKVFNTLLSRSSKIPRNFIIDQTNVYKSARKRKLKPFADFVKIAVVVFPRAEELKFRTDRSFQQMGKAVSDETVNEMLANYNLPISKDMHMADEYFDQVWFVELSRDESQRILDEMKKEMHEKLCKPVNSRGKSSVMSLQPRQKQLGFLSNTENQGVGNNYHTSYSSPQQSVALFESYNSTSTYGGVGDTYKNYKVLNANYDFGGTANSSQSNIGEPKSTSSSLYNTCNNALGDPWYHISPVVLRSASEPASYFPNGSLETPIPHPPIGSFPLDEQHATDIPPVNSPMDIEPNYGKYSKEDTHPAPIGPTPVELPMDVKCSGGYLLYPHPQ